MRTMLQILGMVLLVLGAQGLIRVLVDRDDAGLFGRLPGGLPAHLAVAAGLVLAGAALARGRAHAAGRRAGS